MSQSVLLKARGLFTYPNNLSEVPEGALTVADNVIIDRNGVVEPRRGFAQYGDTFGITNDRAKQLMGYKRRILLHYNDLMNFDDGTGTFIPFSGSYLETELGLRIKSVESNGNFYFTTSTGVKVISATNASEFTGAADYIRDAGSPEALDILGTVNYTTAGFLTDKSKVAYRITWAFKDANGNLVEGAPSSRLVVTNFSDVSSATVDLNFAIPSDIGVNDTQFYYRIYRTQVVQAATVGDLDNVDPGDEMNLVIEDFPTPAELIARSVQVEDITPEDFRTGGELLYTNPTSGEGILQANTPPPFAKDLALFQNTVFYANTATNQTFNLSFLSVSQLVSGTSFIFISSGENVSAVSSPALVTGNTININNTFSLNDTVRYSTPGTVISGLTNNDVYYIVNPTATSFELSLTPSGATVVLSSDGVGTQTFLLGSIYTFVGEKEITDFTFPAKAVVNDGGYFLINSASNARKYFVWFDKTGTTPLPVGVDTTDRLSIRVDISSGAIVTATDVANAVILQLGLTVDFVAGLQAPGVVRVINANNGNTVDATNGAAPVGVGFAIVVFQQGDGEDQALNHILLSANPSPSQAIDETARSLINIINNDPSSSVNAFYLSGPDDVPGLLLLKTRDLTSPAFHITTDNATTGSQFNPTLPTSGQSVISTNEVEPNALYYSKFQQPEAVPIVNKFSVGPKDRAILRILPLRDSLFVLKEDGIYRVTGQAGAFILDPFDNTTSLIAPDSAVVLNNQIYMLSDGGIVKVSDTGVDVISRPIENNINKLSSSNYNFELNTFGIAYETDRAYYMWTVTNVNDTIPTQCFRFNVFTNSWTRFPISKICGIINFDDDKLYLGPSDKNFIEQERKSFNRTDYADREYPLQIPGNGITGRTVTLSSIADVEIGDVLLQTQNLTISQYNQLLKKLDIDPGVLDGNYFIMLEATVGVNFREALDDLAIKLDNDPGVNNNTFLASLGGGTTFVDFQNDFNIIVNLLNVDTGALHINYPTSTGIATFEALIIAKIKNSNNVELKFSAPLIQGDVILSRGIKSEVIWVPQTFGDASLLKQVSEGTIMFEDTVFYAATVSYASDLSPDFETIDFNESGIGDWGAFVWNEQNWGGAGSQVPLRTYIPRDKQRCRFIKPRFQHLISREKFALFGLSLTFRPISTRAYRE